MGIVKKLWKDLPSKDTPLSAEGLNDFEARVDEGIDEAVTVGVGNRAIVDENGNLRNPATNALLPVGSSADVEALQDAVVLKADQAALNKAAGGGVVVSGPPTDAKVSAALAGAVPLRTGLGATDEFGNTYVRAGVDSYNLVGNALGPMPSAGPPVLDYEVWYDASQGEAGVADGGPVSQITNRSGNFWHAVPGTTGSLVTAARPTWRANVQNGKAGYLFDGVDDVARTVGYGLNQPFTVIACAQPGRGADADESLVGTTSSAGLFAMSGNTRWRASGSGANSLVSDNGTKANVATVVAWTMDGGEAGTLATGTTGANNAITWTARRGGPGAARVALVNAGASQALSVTSAANVTQTPLTADVTVTLATDGASVVTSTAAQVIAAVNAHQGASQILTAANTTGSTGAGVVVAAALSALSAVGELYINGRLRTRATNLTAAGVLNPIYIGGGTAGAAPLWGGYLFELFTFPRRLSPGELALMASYLMRP